MPEMSLKDSIITSLNAQEPWPNDVKLFQPYEVEQILLPDNASCLAVQAFLKMSNLPFEVEMRWNAEFMSPSGRVPFIKCGAFVVSELEPIVQFAANKGVTLCSRLSTEEKAEMRAYMSLITNVLVNAELYISWVDNDTFNQVTKVRNSSVYPWPLGWIQTRTKRNAIIKRLKALHWYEKTMEQVLADVEQCCNSLSQRLGDKDYFFGTPTALDALIYGHVRAILAASGPKAALMIKPITTALLKLTTRVATLTHMKLMPQEEYLISQAMHISRRRLSPDKKVSERSTHMKRSKMSMRNDSRDLVYKSDVFGFKPFASKKIVVMSTKDGGITCERNNINYETYEIITLILEDILDKVSEMTYECDESEDNDDQNDFEVIAFPNVNVDSKYGVRVNYDVEDGLTTIEENDVTDTTNSTEVHADDVFKIIDDDEDDDDMTSNEGLAFKVSVSNIVPVTNMSTTVLDKNASLVELDDSTNKQFNETYLTGSSEERYPSNKSGTSCTSVSAGSKSTLKRHSSEEISIERLLKQLRKRNNPYSFADSSVDVD